MLFVPPSIPYMVPEAEAQSDTTPPEFLFTTGGFGGIDTEIPSGGLLTVHATNSTGQNAYFGVYADGVNATWTDATCSASPEPTYTVRYFETTPANNPSSWWKYGATFPIGTTTVTCTATDDAGNVGTASLIVDVVLEDTTPPVLLFATGGMGGQATEIPSGGLLTVDATNSTGQNAYFGIFCSFPQYDSYCMENNINVINTTCSASPEPTYTVNPYYGTYEGAVHIRDDPSSWWRYGATFPIGTTTVTCTGTDEDGNVGTGSLTINVILPESSDTTPPEEEIVVPDWIKFNAGWWASGQINDDSFVAGLQWLITNGIMHIPATEQGAGSDSVIPSWIKSNAEWWANDLIDDRNFVTGLQWLITNGIMVIG